MSLPALLQLDRPHRISLDRAATLRDGSQEPLDVVVHDISSTGCLVSTDAALTEGMPVTIGIAGLGMRPARIVRQRAAMHGLVFLESASESELLAARNAETLVEGGFAAPRPAGETAARPDDRYPLRTRFLIIAGTSVALWAAIGGGVVALLR